MRISDWSSDVCSSDLADHHAGTGGVDRDARLLGRPLDDDARNAGLLQALAQVLADAQVLVQQVRIGVVGKPAGIPGAVDSQPQADRIVFFTHYAVSSRSRTTTVRRLHGFTLLPARPRARDRNRIMPKTLPTLHSATRTE